LAPVDLAVELEPPRPGVQANHLPHRAGAADPVAELDLGAQPSSADGARLRAARLPYRLQVERVDVPGLVLRGAVVEELQPVGRRSERFAAARHVDERPERAVAADLSPQEAVVQRDDVAMLRNL